MPSLTFSDESKIFAREDALLPEYLPELLPHRESQIQLIADNIKPAAFGRKPQNSFLFGAPGIGKTATTKFIFRQFEEFSERVKTIYINCWDYKTAHAVLSKIAIDIGQFVQRRGMGKDEIIEKLAEACRKSKKSVVVALDEVDQLVYNDEEVLYDLLRIGQYVDNPFGFIFISNHADIFAKLEPRIRSSLSIDEVQFKPYTLEEMKNILQKRSEAAFQNVQAGVVPLAAYHAVKKGGDVRAGLEILLKAGRIADKDAAKELKVEHVRKVVGEVERPKPKILREKITDAERQVLEIVEEKKKMTAGELYEEYKKRSGELSERRVRELLNHLEETGLIKSRKALQGFKGNTRILYIG
ncbi:MAG TPA: AAA family ATPase [archaeon]|nr:AAA family ATPase [archaeon]